MSMNNIYSLSYIVVNKFETYSNIQIVSAKIEDYINEPLNTIGFAIEYRFKKIFININYHNKSNFKFFDITKDIVITHIRDEKIKNLLDE